MKAKPAFFFVISIFIVFSACMSDDKEKNKNFRSEDKSPIEVGKKVTDDLLSRKKFMMYNSGQCASVHYAEVCTAFGAVRLAGMLRDSVTLSKLMERYKRVIDDSIVNTANHVDVNVYGILPLELYIQTGSELFFNQGIELADGQWKNPLPDGLTNQTRFWIDDIWMIGSLQVQAYRATGEMKYLDRAALEVNAYLQRLQQPNGLFFHGENAPFFWGRGNGWVAAGLAELLSELPKDNPYYDSILEGYKKMMDALIEYQADDGMWRQLVNVDSAWKETSCTGMFGYALALGVKKGILSAEKYEDAYQKAWLSLVDYINNKGKISDVCVGTGKGTNMQYYLDRPKAIGDFHGQAPVLWFAYALLL